MRTVTFLVLEGVDKGRVYKDLPIPVTIGREEGNGLRLNDERVSRFHAKVQVEDNDIILTDLDSTNGTRVNGTAVQIRRLRPGDQVSIGRSMLLFGTMEEIAARKAAVPANNAGGQVQTIRADELQAASGRVSVADSQRTVAPSRPGRGVDRVRRRRPAPPAEAHPVASRPSRRNPGLPAQGTDHGRREHRRERGRHRGADRVRRVANDPGRADAPRALRAQHLRTDSVSICFYSLDRAGVDRVARTALSTHKQ